jgi:hypothetical protein
MLTVTNAATPAIAARLSLGCRTDWRAEPGKSSALSGLTADPREARGPLTA